MASNLAPPLPQFIPATSLTKVVASLAMNAGFEAVHESCLECLHELLDAYLYELALTAKTFSEAAGRSSLMVTDLVSALDKKGTGLDELADYYYYCLSRASDEDKHENNPQSEKINRPTRHQQHIAQAKDRPGFVPEFLPPFPDPHTYVRTEALKQPEADYEQLREKYTIDARGASEGLSRFLSRTRQSVELMPGLPLLVANELDPRWYLKVLDPPFD